MADLTKPYTFLADTPAIASEVNADFDALFAGHNAQEDSLEVLATYRTLLRTQMGLNAAPGAIGKLFPGEEIIATDGTPDLLRFAASDSRTG